LTDWKDWSSWLVEGYYVSYMRDSQRFYEKVIQRDFAHYEYDWYEDIAVGATSGPVVPDYLEITKGYDRSTNTNQLWQLIFGIYGQAYIYIELPTDLHRHGIPKFAKPNTVLRRVSHFEEWMSPFYEPTFITEHFMMRPETFRIGLDAYNPEPIVLRDLKLNFMIAKLETERLGTVESGNQKATVPRWEEALDKLHRGVLPCRNLTLMPVRAPVESVAGE